MAETPAQPPTPPAAPPTERIALPVEERPSSWPTVLGTISIVFGALGIVCNGSTALTSSQPQSSMRMTPATQPIVMPAPTSSPAATATQSGTTTYATDATSFEPSQEWQPWTVGMSLVSIGLSFVLVAAGIGLIIRRAWAAKLSRTWGALALVLAITTSTAMYLMLQEGFGAVPQGPGNPMPGFFGALGVAFACGSFLVTGTLPIFMLVWFARAKIKTEVAHWA